MAQVARRDKVGIEMRHAIVDADPPICDFCGNAVPAPRRYKTSVKYCNEDHRDLMHKQRAKDSYAKKLAQQKDGIFELEMEEGGRAGQKYEEIKEGLIRNGQWNAFLEGEMSLSKLGQRFSVTSQAMGRYAKTGRNERIQQIAAAGWSPSKKHARMLGPPDEDMAKLLEDDPDKFEKELVTLTDAFVEWRTQFFQAGFETLYITKDVHKRWIRATLHTIYTGGRSLILSPPRHGKTDLLIHFCIWLICRNPNIRILWVGPNGDIAENCLGQVRDLLEGHDDLAEAYLAPGESWAPKRRGGGALWSRQKFTVATRNVTLKQPTMWCTGVGGKILSLDCDFIIVDDPADPDDSQTPGGRDKIEKWFKIKLITRKMYHTGLAMISSRVHPEDLYSEFIDSDMWSVVVDRAHDQSVCGNNLWDEHKDDQDCVLFPEVNPLVYLREQQDVVGDALFEMMYLNQPRPDGTMIFDPELIRQECFDHSRDIGLKEIGGVFRLVAGLDPAARGVQAAFLWAVALPGDRNDDGTHTRDSLSTTFYMVDMETQRAGGPEGAHRVMREWAEKYGVSTWVVEDNAYQSVFFTDPRTKALGTELGLDIKPTTTGSQKHDPDFGVAGMAPLFHDGHVNLPYGTTDAKRKTEQYVKQLVNFTGDTARQGRKHLSDILMASWFPHATVIKKWRKEARHDRVQQSRGASYSGYVAPTWSEAPWPGSSYPT